MKKIFTLLFVAISFFSSAQKRTIIFPDGNDNDIQMVKPDAQGKYIYTVDASKCVMWEAKTGKQLYSFLYDGSRDVTGMDISPNGKLIAIVRDGAFNIFNTETAKEIKYDNYKMDKEDPNFSFSIRDVIFTDDDNLFLSVYSGIAIMNIKTQSLKKFVKTPSSFDNRSKIFLLKDNKLLLASKKEVTIYDGTSAQQISTSRYEGEDNPIYYYAGHLDKINLLPRQNLIIASRTLGDADSVRFYEISTGKLLKKIKVNKSNPLVIPSINTDEFLISNPTSKDGDNSLVLYNSINLQQQNKNLKNTNSDSIYYKFGYFDGLKKEVLFSYENKVAVYNIDDQKIKKILKGKRAGSGFFDYFFGYNQTTGMLNLRSDDHYVNEIDLNRMKTIRQTDLQERPQGIAISNTGDTVALFESLTVIIKNIKTNKIVRPKTLLGCKNFADVDISFFSRDGQFLFYGKDNKELFKMNIKTGVQQKVFSVHGFMGGVNTDDDKTIMYGVDKGFEYLVASVWDLATGKKIFSKNLYDFKSIASAIVSADKKKILIQNANSFWLYDIATKKALIDSLPLVTPHGLGFANSDFSMFIYPEFNTLTARDVNGKELYKISANSAQVGSIHFLPGNKIFYTNVDKFYEAATGRFLGTLYLFKGTNDYVFMDPDGRFDGTANGMKSLYYVLKRKPISLDALYEKYYTPNLYARLVANEKFIPIDVADIHDLPTIKMTYAATQRNLEVEDDIPSYTNTTGAAEIIVTATAPDDAVDEIRLFQNGKVVTLTTRNLIVEDNKSGTDTKKYKLALVPGQNSIRSIALNSQRTESDPDEITVNYKTAENNTSVVNNKPININDKPIDPIDKTATLHLVVVGINQYQNKKMSLNYALADATSFKEELEKDVKSVIANVKTYFVTDDAASKKGITDAFAAVQQNAKPQDVFIFYYAGHGVIGKDKEFYLVPTDVSNLADVQTELEQKGIPSKLLQQYAIDIQAQKQLFILDACQSAGAFETLMSNDGNQQKSLSVVARSTGTHWMAASGAKQYANEFASLGHGVFTYILLQALKGEAANNKQVTVNGLKNFLQIQVPALMKKYNGVEQYPASYGFGNDFPVEVVK